MIDRDKLIRALSGEAAADPMMAPRTGLGAMNLAGGPPPQMPAPANNVYTISPGPEYNKWDEALRERGRIRLPRELDDPQTWLGQDHIKTFLNNTGTEREDLPDGSVILTRRSFTS